MQLEVRIKMNDKLYLRNPEESALGKKIVKYGLVLINKVGFEDFTFKKLSMSLNGFGTSCLDFHYFILSSFPENNPCRRVKTSFPINTLLNA